MCELTIGTGTCFDFLAKYGTRWERELEARPIPMNVSLKLFTLLTPPL